MYNYGRFNEPDLYPHIGNEKNSLIVTRIDIEGQTNQRVVLTVPVTKLRYFEDYTLIIRQPIPGDAHGLPLYIKAVEDKAFVPDVSAGFGYKHTDSFNVPLRHEYKRNDGNCCDSASSYDSVDCDSGYADGYSFNENVEVIKERIEAKIFPVTIAPYGNLAFGENLLQGGRYDDEARAFVNLYLNDQNQFVITAGKKRRKYCCPPKKLIKVVEVVTREPKVREALDRDVIAVPYGHQKVCSSHDYFIEGGCGHGKGYGW